MDTNSLPEYRWVSEKEREWCGGGGYGKCRKVSENKKICINKIQKIDLLYKGSYRQINQIIYALYGHLYDWYSVKIQKN